MSVADEAHKLATGLAEIAESVQPLREFLSGYRAQMEGAGFSPTAAEQMAVQAHAALWQKIANS